ncbi:MAG: peptide MFS transporter [Phycisphaeraceae bacterium]|nr:peptide MFS transporter [Phycisphaeraceae bacterium]
MSEQASSSSGQPIQPQWTEGRTLFGHPIGLFLLFLVEMWERFSYYGMRALLVLYLIRPLSGDETGFNPGRGWSREDASILYGWYTGLAYLFPVIGGIIADKMIGTHRSMVVGGVLITLGHIVLAVSGIGDMAHNEVGMTIFVSGLALIVLGTGHFKPSVSVMVGQLYPPGDPRRDGAFSIFYMGINVGAFICAFICGTLGEKVGWHWGFGSAAVGMILGLLLYIFGRPLYLKGIGMPPAGRDGLGLSTAFMIGSCILAAVFALLYHNNALGVVNSYITPRFTAVVAGIVLVGAVWFVAIQRPADRGPVVSIFIFMMFNAFFWIAFEQAGSSINIFTERNTDRMIGSFEVPATWFQSVNPLIVILFAPVFGFLWTALGRKKLNPSQPAKIALGLLFLGFGYIFMTWAGVSAKEGAKAGMLLIFLTYFWHTIGELCLSPTGLSYVTKVAPKTFVSLLMGIWFVSSFIANLGGGLVAAQVEKIERGELKTPWSLGGQADFFFLFVVTSVGAGLLILVFTPLLKKLIRGREEGIDPDAA